LKEKILREKHQKEKILKQKLLREKELNLRIKHEQEKRQKMLMDQIVKERIIMEEFMTNQLQLQKKYLYERMAQHQNFFSNYKNNEENIEVDLADNQKIENFPCIPKSEFSEFFKNQFPLQQKIHNENMMNNSRNFFQMPISFKKNLQNFEGKNEIFQQNQRKNLKNQFNTKNYRFENRKLYHQDILSKRLKKIIFLPSRVKKRVIKLMKKVKNRRKKKFQNYLENKGQKKKVKEIRKIIKRSKKLEKKSENLIDSLDSIMEMIGDRLRNSIKFEKGNNSVFSKGLCNKDTNDDLSLDLLMSSDVEEFMN